MRVLVAVLASILLLARLAAAEPAAESLVTFDSPICGTRDTPLATYDHVVWIWLENHSYGSIVGSGAAPFINKTLIPACGLATNAHNITHPSLPNYIAATSGLSPGAVARFKSDCNARGSCRTKAVSIFEQAPSWGAYEESMPKPCTHWFTGPYAASHNPPPYYRRLKDCALHDVGYDRLDADLAAGTLPAFVFITPDMCHSMHSCPVGTGDAWLAHAVKKLVSSPAYQAGTMAIFVTWDEGENGGSDHCARNVHDGGCHVATIVVSPYTRPGTRSRTLYNHYSLLRTTEELLGVEPYLRKAASAASMRAAFGL